MSTWARTSITIPVIKRSAIIVSEGPFLDCKFVHLFNARNNGDNHVRALDERSVAPGPIIPSNLRTCAQ